MSVPTQPAIFSAFLKALDKLGVKRVHTAEVNAVIEAATLVHRELSREKKFATPAMGLAAWMASDDTGMSSEFMAVTLRRDMSKSIMRSPRYWRSEHGPSHPRDGADFGRCVRMLRAAPELRERIGEMAAESPEWAGLVERWSEMETLYDQAMAMPANGTSQALWRALDEVIEQCLEPL